MTKTTFFSICCLLIGFGTGALLFFAPDHLGPCPTEDSSHCYWDADVQGNGEGHDFVAK